MLVEVVLVLVGFYVRNTIQISEKEYYSIPEVFRFDDYDKCLYQTPSDQASYCFLTIQLSKNETEGNKFWDIIQEVNSNPLHYRHDILRYGVCTTTDGQNFDYVNQTFGKFGLKSKIVEIDCKQRRKDDDYNNTDYIIMEIVTTYVIFVILVSIYVKFEPKSLKLENSAGEKFLKAFSLSRNLKEIFSKNPSESYLPFLQGLRFMVSLMVLSVHIIAIAMSIPLANVKYAQENTNNYVSMLFASGGIIVQIYFVISSFLMANTIFQKLKNGENLTFMYIVKSVVKRYVRLTPAYLLVIVFHSTVLPKIFDGPFWDRLIGEECRNCRKNWWHNLLYFNNVDSDICLVHSWYLAVDFQFTVLGLFILYLVQRKPRNVIYFSIVLMVIQILVLFFLLKVNNFEIGVKFGLELLYGINCTKSKLWKMTWTSTYSNFAALGTGLVSSYYHSYHRKKSMSQLQIAKWYLTTLFLMGAPVFFSAYYMKSPHYSNSPIFAPLFGSIHKLIFALGVGFLIRGMAQGLGGYFKEFFQLRAMDVLGKLTFGAYLVHLTILQIEVGSRKTPLYLSYYILTGEFIENMTISYLLSVLLNIFIILPFEHLSKNIV